MTKDELVEKIAEDAGISKKDAGEALKAFTSTVSDAMAKGKVDPMSSTVSPVS